MAMVLALSLLASAAEAQVLDWKGSGGDLFWAGPAPCLSLNLGLSLILSLILFLRRGLGLGLRLRQRRWLKPGAP